MRSWGCFHPVGIRALLCVVQAVVAAAVAAVLGHGLAAHATLVHPHVPGQVTQLEGAHFRAVDL